MSNPRNSYQDDNSALLNELDKYKKSLAIALKRQADLEKRIKIETSNLSIERKKHNEDNDKFSAMLNQLAEEKSNLLQHIEQRNIQIEKFTAHGEKLELELIKANEQIKNLTEALQQRQQITSSPTLESKPAAIEPVTEVAAPKTVESTTATAASSSYSMFSPWRILGYTDEKPIPTQENPAHKSLSDLTKASIEREKSALLSVHK